MNLFEHTSHLLPLTFMATGMDLKHPIVVRIAEAAVLGIASGALTLIIGVKLLEKDIQVERERLTAHLVRYDAQLVKTEADLARQRLDNQANVDLVIRKLERIEDCIRIRSCTR